MKSTFAASLILSLPYLVAAAPAATTSAVASSTSKPATTSTAASSTAKPATTTASSTSKPATTTASSTAKPSTTTASSAAKPSATASVPVKPPTTILNDALAALDKLVKSKVPATALVVSTDKTLVAKLTAFNAASAAFSKAKGSAAAKKALDTAAADLKTAKTVNEAALRALDKIQKEEASIRATLPLLRAKADAQKATEAKDKALKDAAAAKAAADAAKKQKDAANAALKKSQDSLAAAKKTIADLKKKLEEEQNEDEKIVIRIRINIAEGDASYKQVDVDDCKKDSDDADKVYVDVNKYVEKGNDKGAVDAVCDNLKPLVAPAPISGYSSAAPGVNSKPIVVPAPNNGYSSAAPDAYNPSDVAAPVATKTDEGMYPTHTAAPIYSSAHGDYKSAFGSAIAAAAAFMVLVA